MRVTRRSTYKRSISRSLALSLPFAAAQLCVASSARADEAANTATARALGVEGVTLAEAGKCAEAIEKLERAERLHHAPTTATRLGECEIEVGRLVSGTERLQRVVREPLPPNAHPAFAAAVVRAEKGLVNALPRIATLRISVMAPPGTKLTVAIDDEPAPDAILDSNRRIDPGPHKISVTANGFLPNEATTSLDEGQTKTISLVLRPAPNAPAERTIGSPSLTTEATRGPRAPTIVAFGIGALGLGAGILGAITVANKSRTLEGNCNENKVCPTDSRSDITSAKQWATASTIGFVAGGVGVATGIVLLLSSGSAAPHPPPTGLRVRPSLGAASVGIDGVF
jgi:hypothetical protein